MEESAEVIQRMQQNLATIRKVAGWTSQRLADEIGVTRQTVSSLEHGRTLMTKTQYIALRYVLNLEAAVSGNQALAKVIEALVDDPVKELDEGVADSDQKAIGGMGAMRSLSVATGLVAGGILAGAVAPFVPGFVLPATALAASSVVKAVNQMMGDNSSRGE